MKDAFRLPADLAIAIKQARLDAGLSIVDVARKAGRVRDVVYRLESGADTTVASLMAVLSALKLSIRLEKEGMPSLEEVQARFGQDEADE